MMYEELLSFLSVHRRSAIILLTAIPAITFAISMVHGVYDGRTAPWRQFYALAVHLLTALVATTAAAVALVWWQGGDVLDTPLPRLVAVVLVVSWLATLLFVKRAVDFRYLFTVRNPFVLLFGWLAGWGVGAVLYRTGLWLIPGPPVYTALAATLLVLLVLQMLYAMTRPRR